MRHIPRLWLRVSYGEEGEVLVSVERILESLNEKQRAVCQSQANYVLMACPGSGKTRTITHRMAYMCASNPKSRKLNIAITYTNRAAHEIEDRLDKLEIDMNAVWAGTIHQFCMKYIVRPYAMYSERLRYGYRIIDEYVQDQYLSEIATELKINTGYNNPRSFPEIEKRYLDRLASQKEIDFEQILVCAYELLSNNEFISDNVASLISSIHVDEYQDTNEYQYSILALLVRSNKSININFVGDVNQAIFGGLGGKAKSHSELENMFAVKFVEECLSGCYRSSTRITDFYSNFAVKKEQVYSISENASSKGVIVYNKCIDKKKLPVVIAAIIKNQLEAGIQESDICVVAPQWHLVFELANELRKMLPDVRFDAPDVTPFKYDPMSPFYRLAELYFTQPGSHSNRRVRMAKEILDTFREEYFVYIPEEYDSYDLLRSLNAAHTNISNGLEAYEIAVTDAIQTMGIDLNREELLWKAFDSFIQKAKVRIQRNKLDFSYAGLAKCFQKKEGIVMNVIHGVKGEEYHTVIGYGLLNGYLPHWNYIMKPEMKNDRRSETLHLIYVLCSRAKENLFLFSELGRKTQRDVQLTPTDEMQFDYSQYDMLSSLISLN